MMMHLNSRAFRCFLHDVHHAYLLLHRAMQTIPPTMVPDLEPMPLPSQGLPNQYTHFLPEEHPEGDNHSEPHVEPASPVDVDDSASEALYQAILNQPDPGADPSPTRELRQDAPTSCSTSAYIRHLEAPESSELPTEAKGENHQNHVDERRNNPQQNGPDLVIAYQTKDHHGLKKNNFSWRNSNNIKKVGHLGKQSQIAYAVPKLM